jgi:hypothetical protein
MSTLAVFNRAKKQNRAFKQKTLRERGYKFASSEQGRIARSLYLMDRDARGRMCEFIVAEEFRNMGYEVEVLSGCGRHDVNIVINDKRYRVEVKSSLIFHTKRNTHNAYCMSSIKPKHFDILVFVFVSPNGITYKIMNQKSFMQHFATRFACRKEGYSVPFSVHCRNRYEQRKRYVLDFTSNNVMALCA